MQLPIIPLCGLLLVLNLQLFSTLPLNTGLNDDDINLFKALLRRLEESVTERVAIEEAPAERMEAEGEGERLRTRLDETAIRELLSARNLKTVRNDSSRRSSSCFGARMDRIGTMSSLGCNSAGRYNPKRR